jgi:DnaK suppressor protein
MDKQTLKTIKEKLLASKKELEERLADFTKRDPSKPDNYKAEFPDYGSKDDENAAEVAAFSDRLSLEHQLEKDLRDVNRALENIKKGTYGVCKYCSQPIEEGRLLARPTSSSCTACKKKLKGED